MQARPIGIKKPSVVIEFQVVRNINIPVDIECSRSGNLVSKNNQISFNKNLSVQNKRVTEGVDLQVSGMNALNNYGSVFFQITGGSIFEFVRFELRELNGNSRIFDLKAET